MMLKVIMQNYSDSKSRLLASDRKKGGSCIQVNTGKQRPCNDHVLIDGKTVVYTALPMYAE